VAGVIVLDASVLIALIDIDDAHASTAAGILGGAMHERLSAHRLTLAEALVHPARTGSGTRAAAHLDALGIEPIDAPDDPLELALLRSGTGLAMPDCCVLLAATRARSGLATFDARLARAARDAGLETVGA
jgi:predicted nucleic acid-binding protein